MDKDATNISKISSDLIQESTNSNCVEPLNKPPPQQPRVLWLNNVNWVIKINPATIILALGVTIVAILRIFS